MAARPMHISDVYASQLEDRVEGYPLWFPEGPDHSDEIDIGDVGYIREGQFVELFKSKYALDDARNAKNKRKNRIPPSHKPLPEKAYSQLLTTTNYLDAGMYPSKSLRHTELRPSAGVKVPTVAGLKLSYSLSALEKKVAFLCITQTAFREMAENSREFKRYIKQHYNAWREHAKHEVGLDVKTHDIIVVQGYVKTAEWAVLGASLEGAVSQSGSFQLQGGLQVVGNIGIDYKQKISKNPHIQCRHMPDKPYSGSRSPSPGQASWRDSLSAGPSHSRNPSTSTLEVPLQPTSSRLPSPRLGEEVKRDQCIFLRYFQVKWRIPGTYWHIKAGAGPHQLPRDPSAGGGASSAAVIDSGSDDDIETNPSSHKAHTWVDILLEYLLRHSDADVAIACHGDIFSLLSGENAGQDFANFLEQKRPRIEVEDGVATLDLADLVVNQRMREMSRHLLGTTNDNAMDLDAPEDGDNMDARQGMDSVLADGILTLGSTSSDFRWPHLSLTSKEADAGSVSAIAVSPDDKLIVVGCVDGTMQLWSSKTGQLITNFEGDHVETVWSVAFSPNGSLLASGDTEGTILIRAMQDIPSPDRGEQELGDTRAGKVIFKLQGHESDVNTVVFSPDGKWLASGSVDCTAMLWNLSLDARDDSYQSVLSPTHVLSGLSPHIMHTLFTPDSKQLISSGDTVVKVWDVETGSEVATMVGHNGAIWCLALSHDAKRLITGCEDCTSRIWDIATGDELVTIAEHSGPVWSVAWSPDDNYVVSGSYDSTAVVCDSYTGERTHEFSGSSAGTTPVVWMPYGDLACTGSADGFIKLWDTKTGHFVADFQGHSDKIKDLIPTKDGKDLISTSDDGTVRVWNVSDVMRLC